MKSNYDFYTITEKDLELMSRILRTSFECCDILRIQFVFDYYDKLLSSSIFPELTHYQDFLCRRAIIYIFKACDCLPDCLAYIDELFNEFKSRGDFLCK